MDFTVHYDDHRRQMAWVNANDWQFERPTRRRQIRRMVARARIAVAARLARPIEQPHAAS